MNKSHKTEKVKERILLKGLKSSVHENLFELLNNHELNKLLEKLEPKHRKRVFPPKQTLSMFISQIINQDSSCQKVVNEIAIKRAIANQIPCSTSTGAYCKAREKLPITAIKILGKKVGILAGKRKDRQWLWHGREVKLIDGTTAFMADSESNQEHYPQLSQQKQGLGFPICRMVGIISLSTGALLNIAIGKFSGKGSSEQTLTREIIDTFKPYDIVLGDAYYSSYFLLSTLISKKVDGVFEQYGARKRSTDFSKGKRLGDNDHLITITKPKKRPSWMSEKQFTKEPDSIVVRELKVGKKILVTTLLSPKKAPATNLKKLYKSRWNIELDFRNIKTTLGMSVLSCKTPKMIEKEIWIYLLAYNILRLLINQSAKAIGHPRVFSFKYSLQLWVSWQQLLYGLPIEIPIDKLLAIIGKKKVGNREGRVEPRAIKKRNNTYPLLTKNRELVRKDILANGHPKKLK